MQLSALVRHTSTKFSSNGNYAATIQPLRVTIRNTWNLELINIYATKGKVERLEWSPDSEYFLCAIANQPLITVYSVKNHDWVLDIREDVVGISYGRWTPDSAHIITVSDYRLRIGVWSLQTEVPCENAPVAVIKRPKHSGKGIAFSNNKSFVAVITREDGNDAIVIYSCMNEWEHMQTFTVAAKDLEDLLWSPDDTAVVMWESSLYCKMLWYGINGVLYYTYEPFKDGLGIRVVQFSPDNTQLAISFHDEAVRILNTTDWSEEHLLEHRKFIKWDDVTIYQETLTLPNEDDMMLEQGNLQQIGFQSPMDSEYVIVSKADSVEAYHKYLQSTFDDEDSWEANKIRIAQERHKFVVPTIKVETPSRSNLLNGMIPTNLPKMGVSMMQYSSSGTYIATKNEAQPKAVWIWESKSAKLIAILLHQNIVRSFSWDPSIEGNKDSLAITTGDAYVYFWRPESPFLLYTPQKVLQCFRADWNPQGGSLLLLGKEFFCVAYYGKDVGEVPVA